MSFSGIELGRTGEELATQFLLAKGYQVLARNLKTRYGEVDILVADGSTAVLVEVKTKSSSAFGQPAEMVGRLKQHKLRTLAMVLASQYNMVEYRIDIIAINLARPNQPVIEHFIAAV